MADDPTGRAAVARVPESPTERPASIDAATWAQLTPQLRSAMQGAISKAIERGRDEEKKRTAEGALLTTMLCQQPKRRRLCGSPSAVASAADEAEADQRALLAQVAKRASKGVLFDVRLEKLEASVAAAAKQSKRVIASALQSARTAVERAFQQRETDLCFAVDLVAGRQLSAIQHVALGVAEQRDAVADVFRSIREGVGRLPMPEDQLAVVKQEQRGLHLEISRLESCLALTADIGGGARALGDALVAAIRTTGQVGSKGLPSRLQELEPNVLRHVMGYAGPESVHAGVERRRWGMVLLLVVKPCFAGVTLAVLPAPPAAPLPREAVLKKTKVAQLRSMCTERGLSTEGTKPTLLQALLATQAPLPPPPPPLQLTEAIARDWCQWASQRLRGDQVGVGSEGDECFWTRRAAVGKMEELPIKMSGWTGTSAKIVNGVWSPTAERRNNRMVYKKKSEAGNEYWLSCTEFRGKGWPSKIWLVQNTKSWNARNNECFVYSRVTTLRLSTPLDVPLDEWRILNGPSKWQSKGSTEQSAFQIEAVREP